MFMQGCAIGSFDLSLPKSPSVTELSRLVLRLMIAPHLALGKDPPDGRTVKVPRPAQSSPSLRSANCITATSGARQCETLRDEIFGRDTCYDWGWLTSPG
jgi:hypothetical protein